MSQQLIDSKVGISPTNRLQERNKTFHGKTGASNSSSFSLSALAFSIEQRLHAAGVTLEREGISIEAWFSFYPPTVI